MLTKKELELVNYKGLTPYPGDQYSLDTLKLIRASLKQYEEFYKNHEYEIILSNGEILEFEISEGNLAHMLGVRKEILTSLEQKDPKMALDSKSRTYQLLQLIAEEPEYFVEMNKQDNYEHFNFYRINVRNKVFQKFSNFYDLNFGCIHFDNESLEEKDQTQMKANKFLFTESNEILAPYYMMGLAKSQTGNTYIETLFPNLYENKMFRNQKITYPISLSITTPKDFIHKETTNKQKLELYKKLKTNLKEYKINLDFEYDFENILSIGAKEEAKLLIK